MVSNKSPCPSLMHRVPVSTSGVLSSTYGDDLNNWADLHTHYFGALELTVRGGEAHALLGPVDTLLVYVLHPVSLHQIKRATRVAESWSVDERRARNT